MYFWKALYNGIYLISIIDYWISKEFIENNLEDAIICLSGHVHFLFPLREPIFS